MRTFTSIFICMVFVFTSGCVQAQNSSKGKEAEKMLRDFYTKYFTVFTGPLGATNEHKLEMLRKQYCTEILFRKIPSIIEQTDSDPFLKAQDSDIKYLKTLFISKGLHKDEYIISYVGDGLPGEKVTITIYVTVVKEGESYKIASVK